MTDIFGVIADATRRDILDALVADTHEGMSVSQIVNVLGVSQPTISKHLKVLREAGIVSVREEGQRRFYRVAPSALDSVQQWLRPFFASQLDADVSEDVPAQPVSAARSWVTPMVESSARAVGRVSAKVVQAGRGVWQGRSGGGSSDG